MLNNKQEIAVNAFVSGMDKVAAVTAAGYKNPKEYAKEFFRSKQIKDEIAKRQQAARKRVNIEIDDVLEGLMEGVHAAQNTADLVMAWREIGKIIGAYTQKIEVDVNKKIEHINSVRQLERMTDDDLAQLAEMGDVLNIDDADWQEVDDELELVEHHGGGVSGDSPDGRAERREVPDNEDVPAVRGDDHEELATA